MTATATTMLNQCRSQLGYQEGPRNRTKYGTWYGLPNQPYCAMGLSWSAAQIDATDIMLGRFASCLLWVSTFQKAGTWLYSSATPVPGDIVFFDWSGRHSHADHVGIVESVSGDVVVTIEFNTLSGRGGDQSDGGGVFRRRRSPLYIVGYGRPRYARQSAPVPLPSPPGGGRRIVPLVVDGVWGPKTTGRLQGWLHVLENGRIDIVTRKALQGRLQIIADGEWGPCTRRALQRFLHVTQDGHWGPVTVKALQRYLNRSL